MTDKLTKILKLICTQGYSENIVYRLEAVADLLNCPVEEIYDDIDHDRVHVKRIGGHRSHWRMTTSELLKYIDYRSPDGE